MFFALQILECKNARLIRSLHPAIQRRLDDRRTPRHLRGAAQSRQHQNLQIPGVDLALENRRLRGGRSERQPCFQSAFVDHELVFPWTQVIRRELRILQIHLRPVVQFHLAVL